MLIILHQGTSISMMWTAPCAVDRLLKFKKHECNWQWKAFILENSLNFIFSYQSGPSVFTMIDQNFCYVLEIPSDQLKKKVGEGGRR